MMGTRKATIKIKVDQAVGAEGFELLRDALQEALSSDTRSIVVDLTEAETIDSPCLAALLAATSSLPGDRSLLIEASPRIAHALIEWRFDAVLDVAETPCAT